jgi:ribosomal protein S18 acetylase RimI-like enzyme
METTETMGPQEGRVTIRGLRPADLDRVIAVDAKVTGRMRHEYFKLKLQQNLQETGIKVSLAAEIDGCFCGFLMARLYYGEFGAPEPSAVFDTLVVHPDFQREGVGSALLNQLNQNLRGLRVGKLVTQVQWEDLDLLTFLHKRGFRPSNRICLDLQVEAN